MSVFFRRRGKAAERVNYVPWIQSDGNQFINSEVIGKSGIKVEAKVAWTDTVSDSALIGEEAETPGLM